jgi:glutamyl-tRNA reductase
MDNLNAQLEHSFAERMSEIPQVKKILDEELTLFEDYLKSLDILPLIADMRQNAEAIRQTELEKTLRRLPDLTEAERSHIEAMTQALVKKLLHAPTNRLRTEAASPRASEYADVARKLFNLSDEGARSPSTASD